MLEGVVHAGHLRKLDRSIQILSEPELFEVRNVTHIPDDGTHQRVVLPVQIFVRQSRDQQQRSLSRLGKEVRDLLLRRGSRESARYCKTGCGHGRNSAVNNSAMILPSTKLARRAGHPDHGSRSVELADLQWQQLLTALLGPTGGFFLDRKNDSLVELHWCRLTNRFSVDA